ncbi:hypothetical protein [Sphingobium sp. KCTC 72723]|uniref:hypothetical protein n=1 Tax=Sphingobium sp. KCTC 72723 TaxID=2733867 RepID=UPI00165D41B2|nr:hypothetical protein [Sphingobium sp. KCTC 72723]
MLFYVLPDPANPLRFVAALRLTEQSRTKMMAKAAELTNVPNPTRGLLKTTTTHIVKKAWEASDLGKWIAGHRDNVVIAFHPREGDTKISLTFEDHKLASLFQHEWREAA